MGKGGRGPMRAARPGRRNPIGNLGAHAHPKGGHGLKRLEKRVAKLEAKIARKKGKGGARPMPRIGAPQ